MAVRTLASMVCSVRTRATEHCSPHRTQVSLSHVNAVVRRFREAPTRQRRSVGAAGCAATGVSALLTCTAARARAERDGARLGT